MTTILTATFAIWCIFLVIKQHSFGANDTRRYFSSNPFPISMSFSNFYHKTFFTALFSNHLQQEVLASKRKINSNQIKVGMFLDKKDLTNVVT